MINIILVGLGGALGSILRYITSILFNYFFLYSFIGTLIANIIGSFVVGLLIYNLQNKFLSANIINYFFIIGLLGSYTTFSAFTYETIELVLNNKKLIASIYVLSSCALCIISAYIGLNINKFLNWKKK